MEKTISSPSPVRTTQECEDAFEAFKKEMILVKPHTSTDEPNKLYYSMKRPEFGSQWLRMAQKIIRNLRLPLDAYLQEWTVNGAPRNTDLVIEYKPSN
jgi:hypothetical protein